jgi:hypothetical protein
MGTARHFDIAKLTELYDLHYFVETGVGQAVSLAEVVENHFFRAYYSCDWDEIMVRSSRHRMAGHPYVHIEHARSTEFLESLLLYLPQTSPILFWLDAHFPLTNSGSPDLVLPLASELEVIARLRPDGLDVIAIDDLAIYTEGPFETPLIEELRPWCPEERNIDFVKKTLGKTHKIECLYEDGGYILATPGEKTLT